MAAQRSGRRVLVRASASAWRQAATRAWSPEMRISGIEESFSDGLLEYPQFTRPQEFEGRPIPEILTSGDHARVAAWRQAEAEALTRARRPDLWAARPGQKRPKNPTDG